MKMIEPKLLWAFFEKGRWGETTCVHYAYPASLAPTGGMPFVPDKWDHPVASIRRVENEKGTVVWWEWHVWFHSHGRGRSHYMRTSRARCHSVETAKGQVAVALMYLNRDLKKRLTEIFPENP